MQNIKNILIVEDETIIAENLSAILQRMNYNVCAIVDNGSKALDIISTCPVDLVLMDIVINGDMDGIETARHVFDRYALPVVYTTAFSDDETVKRIKQNGNPYGYVIKPYNSEKLKTAIEVALLRHDYENKLTKSEKKYKILVEETEDIIFSLNKDYQFISVNKAIEKHLNESPENVIGKSLFDYIYKTMESNPSMDRILSDKLLQLQEEMKPVQFNVQFKKKLYIADSPYEMAVRLEKLHSQNNYEILGKAFLSGYDPLMKYLVEISHTIAIDNNIMIVKDVVERITRDLPRFTDDEKIIKIKVALRELIFNSIEHGNLGITFEEKTNALRDDTYVQLLLEKQKYKNNINKKVIVKYMINKNLASFTISDNGDGFDYKSYIDKLSKNEIEDDKSSFHGRGVAMSLKIFDKIEYKGNGNEVTGVINF